LIALTLYHGNTESAIDEIHNTSCFSEKFKSIGERHYLGDGFYFYNDPVQAEVWAKMKVNRHTTYLGQNWAVLKCSIQVKEEQYFELDNREEQEFFFLEMARLQDQLQTRQLEIDEYNDSYLCNHIAGITGVELISKTFSYIDSKEIYSPKFSNDKVPPYSITRHFRTEKQYVIRNSNIIVDYDKIKSGNSKIRRKGAAK